MEAGYYPNEPTHPVSGLPYDAVDALIPPPPPPPSRRRWWIPVLVVLVALLLATSISTAYLLGKQQGLNAAITPTPTPTPTPPPVTTPSFITVRIDGDSMLPALHAGEEVSVDTQAYVTRRPARGDVILFHYPVDPTQEMIKRVIGIPGDTLKLTPTQVFLNGMLLNEPYISEPLNASPMSITLQPDQYFVMGDNRPFSADSRAWGPVSRNAIIGKVIVPSALDSFFLNCENW